MATKSIPLYFTPRDYQLEIFQALDKALIENRSDRNALLVWSRQSGKDTSGFAYMAKEACRQPGNYFYIFPTKEMGKKALWEKIFNTSKGIKLTSVIPKSLIERFSNQEMSIHLKNGSTIRVMGCDKDSDSIRGISPTGIVFSEFAYMDPVTYKAVLPAINANNAWQIINSTPDGRNYFYNMALYAQKSEKWHYSFRQSLYPDQKGYVHTVPPEDIWEQVEAGTMTKEEAEREYGCRFNTEAGGAYFAAAIEKARNDKRVGLYPYDPTKGVYTFWDLGFSDYTSIWFVQVDGDTYNFIDFYEDFNKDLRHYAELVASKGYEYAEHFLPHDGRNRNRQTGHTDVELLTSMFRQLDVGGTIDTAPRPQNMFAKQAMINDARHIFHKFRFNDELTRKGLARLELYRKRWNKVTGSYSAEPVHDESSHAADALLTFIHFYDIISEDRRETLENIQVLTEFDIFK